MITVSQAAQTKGVSRQYLARMCKRGRIKGAKLKYGLWLLPEKWEIVARKRGRPRKEI